MRCPLVCWCHPSPQLMATHAVYLPALPLLPRSDAHALLTHQKGEVDAELAGVREALTAAQDALAAAEVG